MGGIRFGTIAVDLERRRVIDVLPDRSAVSTESHDRHSSRYDPFKHLTQCANKAEVIRVATDLEKQLQVIDGIIKPDGTLVPWAAIKEEATTATG